MKSKFVAICSVILVIVVAVSLLSTIVTAEDKINENGVKLTYIDSYSGSIKKGLVSTTIRAQVTGTYSVTKVKIKMELQKLSSGSYSTVETWEQTFNSISGSMEESKLTNPFSTYRLKATVTAYSGSNSESQTFYEY